MTTIRAATAMSVFDAFDRDGVGYAVVRNHDQIPIDPGRDIDLLAPRSARDAIERILSEAKDAFGWESLVRCDGHHEGTSYYFLGPLDEQGRPRQLEIHFTRIRWAGATILGPEDLIARRERSEAGIWIAAREHSVCQRLLQQGLSGALADMKDEYWAELRAASTERGEAVAEVLGDVLGDTDLAAECVGAMAEGDRARLAQLTRPMRTAFLRAGGGTRRIREAPDIAAFAFRKALRPRRPALCGVVARIDPDTIDDLADALENSVAHMFLETRRIDLEDVGTSGVLKRAADVVSRAGLAIVAAGEPFDESFRWIPRVSVWVPPGGLEEGVDLVLRRFVANHGFVRTGERA
ncbi:MAG TPA: hypothetical protein VLB67_11575 [Acidimicrobiia bacterium]|nr:hypothetical protein [Acidimicrobiia bacterium]